MLFFNRHTVAALDIKVGETLLQERPLVVLAANGERRCVNCYKLAVDFCAQCHVFSLCAECTQHDVYDCQVLAKASGGLRVEVLQQHVKATCFLKILLLRDNPATKEQYVQLLQLEAHQDQRRNTDVWREQHAAVVVPLIEAQLPQILPMDEELLQQLSGIVDVNCFEIRAPDEGSLRGIYLRAALLPHHCVPNCAVAVDARYQLKIYATQNIAQGALVAYCYTNVLLGTAERREMLRIGKYFECNCARCSDPIELGSHMSSLICAACSAQNREGFVVWQVELAPARWQCTHCTHTLARENVVKLLERAKEELFHARDDIYRYEMLLAKLSRFLHRNHHLLIDMKQNIAAILRSIIEHSAQPPGRKVFERKVHLCQEVLNVLCIIQPGISRLRAIAMYELSSSYAELCRKRFNEREISEQELREQLLRVDLSLRESLRMLLYEPPDTPEGRLARTMMQELKQLQLELQQLQPASEELSPT